MALFDAILTISVVASTAAAFTALFNGRSNKASVVYVLNVLSVILWVTGLFVFTAVDVYADLIFWAKFLYIFGITIASSFLFFTFFFPVQEPNLNIRRTALTVFVPNIIFGIAISVTGPVIKDVYIASNGLRMIEFGPAYIPLSMYVAACLSFAFWKLYKKYKRSHNAYERHEIAMLAPGYLIAVGLAFFTNVILPALGFFTLYWVGLGTGLVMAAYASFAMFRNRLYDIRLVATEILTFGLWMLLLARVSLSDNIIEQATNSLFLGIALLFGILLIASIVREGRQKDEILELLHKLEASNRKLMGIDHLKSDIISLATHQIRTPLSAIKGYSSLMLDGDYGQLDGKLGDAAKAIFDSAQRLVTISNKFFNVSQLKHGIIKYSRSHFDMKDLVEEIAKQYDADVRLAGLRLELHANPEETYPVFIDREKLKQALSNLFENAIRFTHTGTLSVRLEKANGKVLFSIRDTGIGIERQNLESIFLMFERANANNVDVTGAGIGLYIAHQIINAQGGRIWAESEGKNKGSTFKVELLEVRE